MSIEQREQKRFRISSLFKRAIDPFDHVMVFVAGWNNERIITIVELFMENYYFNSLKLN